MTEKISCNYCGFDVEVPDGFLPTESGIIEEKFDSKSGASMLSVNEVLVMCRNCKLDRMMSGKTVKAKGKSRENAVKEAKAKVKEVQKTATPKTQ